ncbi:cytochrome P450 [Microbispora rosea subsp. aerata]|nr:cytochrome P450 [Microbispora rosea]GGO28147.1 cytochrome P450 [Microbispora rosea subsp. aerata]GIH56191.1 cytochrome P450 [Microbispora rosea subsp. aerata]GLJ85756.1 cytochrome P450 [Microbispora rosea subsp. aerata]
MDAPVIDIDPFGDEFRRDPQPAGERLQEAGPVVYLESHGIRGMARFAEVHAVLRDHDALNSSGGAGLANFKKDKPWRPPSLLLEADPPDHTRVRRIVSRIMSPRVIESLRPEFERRADELAARVAARGEFDGVAELAQAYPLLVFPDAVGLGPDGRENLIRYGSMVFNSFGPPSELFRQAMRDAAPVQRWIAEHTLRTALSPDGPGARLYDAADRGEITEDEAALLVRSLLSAGVDTTAHALAWALHTFATHPAEWAETRADPTLVRPAFEEVMRLASPVLTMFRTTTREVTVAGTTIPADEKVLLFIAAANRDPREWPDPHRFDIHRQAAHHLSFGTGIHACVGAALARLEAETLFTALTRHVRTLELAGPPRPRPNNSLNALAELPLRAIPG